MINQKCAIILTGLMNAVGPFPKWVQEPRQKPEFVNNEYILQVQVSFK